MKIALIGYGKMGHQIESVALGRGHEIVCCIDKDNQQDFLSPQFRSADVAIEFSTPQTAVDNIRRAWEAGVRVVCGTTGWTEQLPLLQEELKKNSLALVWSSNYSVGVNLFFALNQRLAELMKPYCFQKDNENGYRPSITEIHHIHKLDAPSGTAKTLQEQMKQLLPNTTPVPIESIREGEVTGTHIVRYESGIDTIEISHEAHSREGFALGAVLAAEYVKGKTGFFTMADVLRGV